MRGLTPYLFFLLAIIALGMIALQPDDSWQTKQVDPLSAVLIIAGVFLGAHLLRMLVKRFWPNNPADSDK